MGQLQKIAPQLIELGYQIIAVSPDRPEHLRESLAKNELGYTLLSDAKMTASLAFGIAFKVDDKTVELYKGYGIDLEASSGEKHHLLPVPAVFVVGRDREVKFQYADPDYKTRIDPDLLLAAARSAK